VLLNVVCCCVLSVECCVLSVVLMIKHHVIQYMCILICNKLTSRKLSFDCIRGIDSLTRSLAVLCCAVLS
jgi:hypothetical protein